MQEQVKTFHFWATMINIGIGGAMEVELIPATGTLHKFGLLAMLILTALGVRAAAKWMPTEEPKMILPGEISKFAFLPILFAGAMLLSGCQTAGGKALKTCELNALPAAMQSVEAEVLALAMDPSSWAQDLITLAVKLGKDQVACAAQALAAFFDRTPAPDTLASSVRAFASGPPTDSEARAHAKKVLHDYLTRPETSTSCRPVPAAWLQRGVSLLEHPSSVHWVPAILAAPVAVHIEPVAQFEPCADEEACRPVVVDDDVPTSFTIATAPLQIAGPPLSLRIGETSVSRASYLLLRDSGAEVMRVAAPDAQVYVYGLRVL